MKRTPRSAATSHYIYPRQRKYPIGDLYHARLALGGPYASSGYTTPAQRRKILTEVADAYPQYNWASYWNNHILGNKKPRKRSKDGAKLYPLYNWDRSIGARAAAPRRKMAANPRRSNSMARKNPYGRRPRAGRKAKIVRVRGGKRTHLLNPGTGRALCDSARTYGRLENSASRDVTCYRCLKLMGLNRDVEVERMLPVSRKGKRRTTRKGQQARHLMLPGGREGLAVSGIAPDESGDVSRSAQVDGIEFFLGGDPAHPTQSRLLTKFQKEDRRRILQRQKQGRGKRKGRIAALLEGARVGEFEGVRRGRRRMVGNPSAKQRKAQANAKRAMQLYHSGEADSLADAWDLVRSNPKRRRRRRR